MTPRVEQDILIDAPVDVVWRAVTEPDQIVRWFSDDADLKPLPGYEGALTFRNQDAGQTLTVHVSVQSVAPARSFSYRWLHPQGVAAGEGNSVLVEFTLTHGEGGTRLRVVETGLEHMGWSPGQEEDYASEHNEGWVVYLRCLRDHLGRQPLRGAR
ncbi:SRPBCC domain-containing protein [Microbispora sp. RL4-1S]|uniref:SRPBCC domain-containing protein n=1 Tax=Microbispora oryzae TaxID=2806554 RepID=A0A941AKY2_9ACTN|nr:SRPBCC domain-containing protein [Microbispora oryzae]MBP2707980.1 SRPBCC domain-containing protein [Microbispora oryzae]